MDKFLCYASCSFGLEFAVANELKDMGLEPHSKDARVFFYADTEEIARANLRLACADRVYIVIKQFTAISFDELFEGIQTQCISRFRRRGAVYVKKRIRYSKNREKGDR